MATKQQLQADVQRLERLAAYWERRYREAIETHEAVRYRQPVSDDHAPPEPPYDPYAKANIERVRRDIEDRDKHQTERHVSLAKRVASLETRMRRLEKLGG